MLHQPIKSPNPEPGRLRKRNEPEAPQAPVTLPLAAWKELHRGLPVAAQIPQALPDTVAYLLVIPRVERLFEEPDCGRRSARRVVDARTLPRGTYNRLDNRGYEIRLIRHDARYTDEEWGWDYDLALDDETTRVRRLFVEEERVLPAALAPWREAADALGSAEPLDSTLVNSVLDWYLDQPRKIRRHLWREDW